MRTINRCKSVDELIQSQLFNPRQKNILLRFYWVDDIKAVYRAAGVAAKYTPPKRIFIHFYLSPRVRLKINWREIHACGVSASRTDAEKLRRREVSQQLGVAIVLEMAWHQ